MPTRHSIALTVAALLALAPATASATNMAPGGGAGTRDGFRWQLQGDLLATVGLDAGTFGGVEVQANASVFGFGLAIGLGYEGLPPTDAAPRHGGYLHLALHVRPLTLASGDAWRWFDPHVMFGGRVGALGEGRTVQFRSAAELGVGFDVRLAPTELHPVLVVQYRWQAARTPDRGPVHLLAIGIGVRLVPD